MSVTREELMAYADGELAGADAARIEAALSADPALAREVAAHRALRARLKGQLDPVRDEPVPDALSAMIAAAAREDEHGAARPAQAERPKVISLAYVREERARKRAERTQEATTPPPAGLRWGNGLAIAASLVLGLFLGTQVPIGKGAVRESDGALVASGALALGLESRLAANQASDDAPLRILTSFRRGDGDYCRVFDNSATAGIACKDDDRWILERTMASGAGTRGAYRQAGSAEAELMAAAQDMAQGAPLDAEGEARAKARGWSD